MKSRIQPPSVKLTMLALSILTAPLSTTFGQGTTAFTYQGQLRDNGTYANGAYTMIFRLYDAANDGNQIGGAITNSPTLANGLFTVSLDFGMAAFDGNGRWLDIAIANAGVPETLSPRVHVLPTPYALMAGNANHALTATTADSVPAANVSGTLTDSHLSGNVALRGGGNDFTGNQTITGGSVGIGTTSPLGYSLDIRGNMSLPAGSVGSIYFDGANVTGQEWQLFHNGSEAFGPTNSLVFYNGTAQSSELVIAPSGNVGIGTINPATTLDVNGTVTCVSLNQTSDRNAKEHFSTITPQEVLEKVARLSITRWNFKGDDITVHLGPMAQDFYTAFNVGTDDKHISTVDEGGVALAAIQGLNQKLEEVTREKNAKITELENRLTEIESLLRSRLAK